MSNPIPPPTELMASLDLELLWEDAQEPSAPSEIRSVPMPPELCEEIKAIIRRCHAAETKLAALEKKIAESPKAWMDSAGGPIVAAWNTSWARDKSVRLVEWPEEGE